MKDIYSNFCPGLRVVRSLLGRLGFSRIVLGRLGSSWVVLDRLGAFRPKRRFQPSPSPASGQPCSPPSRQTDSIPGAPDWRSRQIDSARQADSFLAKGLPTREGPSLRTRGRGSRSPIFSRLVSRLPKAPQCQTDRQCQTDKQCHTDKHIVPDRQTVLLPPRQCSCRCTYAPLGMALLLSTET